MYKTFITMITLAMLSGCDSHDIHTNAHPVEMEEINGRDTTGPRRPIYRVSLPSHWIRHDQFPDESIVDTRKPLVEFIIVDGNTVTEDNTIRIVIHNFPYESIEQRIPPQAQISRWQRQFESMETHLSTVQPQSYSGYVGLLFTGVGSIQGRETMVMGWALQLPIEHYRMLIPETSNDTKAATLLQMRADVTIKASGPRNAMETFKEEITAFARSFELIDEIPSRL